MILLAAGCGTPAVPTKVSTASQGCTLPALPKLGSTSVGGARASGPAVTSIRGGAVKRSFSLDGGDFEVTPPKPGDKASVSQTSAECAVLASVDSYGDPALMTTRQGGLAIGLGRVTIAPSLVAKASDKPPGQVAIGGSGSPVAPKVQAPSPYQARLAWVVVMENVEATSCPAFHQSAPATRLRPRRALC